MLKKLNRFCVTFACYFSILPVCYSEDLNLKKICGPICIYQTAVFFDISVTWDTVTSPYETKVQSEGISLLDIRNSIESLGLSAQHKRMSTKEFGNSKDKYAILHLNNSKGGHFIIVRNLAPNGIQIIDYPNLYTIPYSDLKNDNTFDMLVISHDKSYKFREVFWWFLVCIIFVGVIKIHSKYKYVSICHKS
jgi:ABC-type bacteriocin/lantibiotic exporter with double-glycine peptidase domain